MRLREVTRGETRRTGAGPRVGTTGTGPDPGQRREYTQGRSRRKKETSERSCHQCCLPLVGEMRCLCPETETGEEKLRSDDFEWRSDRREICLDVFCCLQGEGMMEREATLLGGEDVFCLCTVSCDQISSSTIHFIQWDEPSDSWSNSINNGRNNCTVVLVYLLLDCFHWLADWRRSCALLPDRVRQIRGLACSILYRRWPALSFVLTSFSTLSQGSNKGWRGGQTGRLYQSSSSH